MHTFFTQYIKNYFYLLKIPKRYKGFLIYSIFYRIIIKNIIQMIVYLNMQFSQKVNFFLEMPHKNHLTQFTKVLGNLKIRHINLI